MSHRYDTRSKSRQLQLFQVRRLLRGINDAFPIDSRMFYLSGMCDLVIHHPQILRSDPELSPVILNIIPYYRAICQNDKGYAPFIGTSFVEPRNPLTLEESRELIRTIGNKLNKVEQLIGRL